MTMADPAMSSSTLHEAHTRQHAPNALALALYRLVVLGFMALGIWVCWYSYELLYYTPVGPGPGYFPMWLGGILTILSLSILGVSFLGWSPVFPARIIPERTPAMQMGVTFGAIAFFALFVERAGFVPVMFVVLAVLLLVNRVSPFTSLLVAAGGSLGVAYLFVRWLGVFLPRVPYDLLSGLGL